MKILDTYFMKEPSIENAIEIFKGTWSSIVPGVETGGGSTFQ